MTMTQVASILPPGQTTYFDANGAPLAGGSVYYFIPNTSTPKNTWSDPYGNTLNPNPVILDAAGRCTVYGEGQYTQAVYDSLGNLQFTALSQDLLQLFSLPATTRIALSGNTSYYVATTGSDSTGNGTSGNPWATIQHAVTYIAALIDLRGYTATIYVADGTYTQGVVISGPFVGQGNVHIIGDSATPANCIISTTSSNCFLVQECGVVNIEGFKLQTTTSGSGVLAGAAGQINIVGPMNFGACADTHIGCNGAGSSVTINTNYTISGSAQSHWSAQLGMSEIFVFSNTITITGTPAFSTAFAFIRDSVLTCGSLTFTGSATGTRFSVSQNGVIDCGTSSLTYFPGSLAGSITSGGVYNTQTSAVLQAVQGTFKNLQLAWSSDTQVSITADAVALANSSNAAYFATSVSTTLATGTAGANGLDTGSLAASTWYYIFVIYNSTTNTVACLMSLSATGPTLPSGYTYFARVGSLRTDGSMNIIGFIQKGRDFRYTVGKNLSALPTMVSGSAGNVGTPTWVAVAVGAFVPSTASMIAVLADGSGTSIVASNTNYGGYEGAEYLYTNPPLFLAGASADLAIMVPFSILLESSNIYYAASGADTSVLCYGFTDNL